MKQTCTETQGVIRQNMQNPEFSLREASRMLLLSERSLQRALAQEGSRGFRWELWSERMRKAEQLLLSGMTSREVAGHVGYRHPEHFARAFRRWSGLSPSSWLASQASP